MTQHLCPRPFPPATTPCAGTLTPSSDCALALYSYPLDSGDDYNRRGFCSETAESTPTPRQRYNISCS
ncbi:hypothetical protein Tco_1280051 [Tanacetum coccineum]